LNKKSNLDVASSNNKNSPEINKSKNFNVYTEDEVEKPRNKSDVKFFCESSESDYNVSRKKEAKRPVQIKFEFSESESESSVDIKFDNKNKI